MKIRKLKIKNYKCIVELEMEDIPDMVVIAGPNGSGKSALLEAIGFFKESVGPYYGSKQIPDAVNINADFAEIEIGFEITDTEKEFLKKTYNINIAERLVEQNISLVGKIKILKNGQIVQEKVDSGLSQLLRYFNPDSEVGIIEYISPHRRLPERRITNISLAPFSLEQEKQFRFYNVDSKFNQLKEYLAALEMKGLQEFKKTGNKVDYLQNIKELFADFFEPKQFVEVEISGSQVNYWVNTPWGKHDIDSLSSGEKEVLMIFANLHKLNLKNSIVLYDEPELHLNAALERKVINQLRKIGLNNQFFVTTHSAEIVDSVPYEELFKINFYKGGNQIRRISEDREKIEIFKSLGANVNLQLISEKVVFVEGDSDKEVLETLFPEYRKRISFIQTQGVSSLMGINQKVADLLEQASKYSSFYLIRDRDFLTDQQIEELRRQYNNRIYVWKRFHIENYFLDSNLIFSVLKDLRNLTFKDEQSIEKELLKIANELKEQLIADWINYELTREIGRLDFKVGGDGILEEKMVARINEKLRKLNTQLSDKEVKKRFFEKRKEIENRWRIGEWKILCPGRNILKRFTSRLNGINYLNFRNLLITKMKKFSKIPEDFKEVIRFILQEG